MTDAFRETAAGTARGPSTRPWAWQTLAPRLVDAEKRLRYRQHHAVVTRAHLAWGTLRRSHVSSSLGGGGPRRRPPNPPTGIPWPSLPLRTVGWEQRSELHEAQNGRRRGVWKPLPLFTDGEAEAKESAGGSRLTAIQDRFH